MPQPEGKGGDGRKSPVLAALPPEAAPARGVEGALRLSEMLAGESWVVTSLCAEGKSVEGREASSGRCNKQGKGCDGSLPNACGVPSTVTSVPLPRTAAVALAGAAAAGVTADSRVCCAVLDGLLGELPVEALAPPKRGSASSLRDGVTLANFMRQSRNTAAAAAARRRKHPEAAATGWEPVASPAEVRAALSNSSDSSNAVALAVATASHEAPILAPGCVAAAARLHAAAASEEAAAADSLHPGQLSLLPNASEKSLLPSCAAARVQRIKRKRQRDRRTVLDEETWERSLSATIEKAYFPDLPLLRLLRQLMAAEGANDAAAVQAVSKKIASLAAATPFHMQAAERRQQQQELDDSAVNPRREPRQLEEKMEDAMQQQQQQQLQASQESEACEVLLLKQVKQEDRMLLQHDVIDVDACSNSSSTSSEAEEDESGAGDQLGARELGRRHRETELQQQQKHKQQGSLQQAPEHEMQQQQQQQELLTLLQEENGGLPERQPPLPMSVDAFFEAFVSEDQHSVQQLLQRREQRLREKHETLWEQQQQHNCKQLLLQQHTVAGRTVPEGPAVGFHPGATRLFFKGAETDDDPRNMMPRGEVRSECTRFTTLQRQLQHEQLKQQLQRRRQQHVNADQSNMHQLVQQGEFRPLPKKPTETHVHLPGGQPIGYSFVQSPVAIPVKSPQDPASNEITWGSLLSTPVLVQIGATTPCISSAVLGDSASLKSEVVGFKMPEPVGREAAAVRLQQKAAEKQRRKQLHRCSLLSEATSNVAGSRTADCASSLAAGSVSSGKRSANVSLAAAAIRRLVKARSTSGGGASSSSSSSNQRLAALMQSPLLQALSGRFTPEGGLDLQLRAAYAPKRRGESGQQQLQQRE
ncbi:uncharacterized protein LOC34620054, partial [Cyclospora cayetanensis]|uniref:Uncharacterized protein LOC34620054 n=1 Tax=Cyclospora cayetanensis TaxID=88456 RepID=A0A6P6RXS6_9EIME